MASKLVVALLLISGHGALSTDVARRWWLGGANNGCADLEEFCALFAAAGECAKNKAVMEANCCKSCEAHGGGTDNNGNTGGKRCMDRAEHCADWAEHGHCDINPGYMLADCCMSCQAALRPLTTTESASGTGEPDGCADSHELCAMWADNGECHNDEAVKAKCCRSCEEHE